MVDIISRAGASYEFVFLTAPYSRRAVWIRDPPGGKGQPTTDSSWDNQSTAEIDAVVAAQGPFHGILGYSQGTAMIIAYLAHAPANTFQVALVFCAYVPTTHNGIIARIDAKTPFSIPIFIFMGVQDSIISNAMTDAFATKFSSPTRATSTVAGHIVPTSSDPTFGQIFTFLEAQQGGPTVAPTAISTSEPTSPPTWAPVPPGTPTQALTSPTPVPTKAPTDPPTRHPTCLNNICVPVPTPKPTPRPTQGPRSITQPLRFAQFTATKWLDLKTVYETAYGISLKLYFPPLRKWRQGCSVTSSARSARRTGIVVDFKATVTSAAEQSANVSQMATALSPVTFTAGVTEANTALSTSVEIPQASLMIVETPTVMMVTNSEATSDGSDDAMSSFVVYALIAGGGVVLVAAAYAVCWALCPGLQASRVTPRQTRFEFESLAPGVLQGKVPQMGGDVQKTDDRRARGGGNQYTDRPKQTGRNPKLVSKKQARLNRINDQLTPGKPAGREGAHAPN